MASVITESTGGKSAAELRVVFLLYESHQSMVVARGLIHEHGIVPRLIVNSSVVVPRRRRLRLLRFLVHPARRRIAVWKVVEVVAGRVASRIGAARHGHAPSAKRLAEEFGIAYERCADVNAAAFQERLRSIDADLLVCIHFNQILKPSTTATTRLGAINVHGALLPRHRGLFPHFYALRHGDDLAGVTVHWIDERIDTGRSIVAESFAVEDDDTVLSLENRAASRSARLVADAIDRISAGEPREASDAPFVNPPRASSNPGGGYHSWPTSEDLRALRARGRRYLRWRDLRAMADTGDRASA